MGKTAISLTVVFVFMLLITACSVEPTPEKTDSAQMTEITATVSTESDKTKNASEIKTAEDTKTAADIERLRALFNENVGQTNYHETMLGDKTGKWRVAVVSILEGDLLDHVVEYHAAYMAPGEVHFLIPITGEYTLLINDFGGDTLYVTRLEHIDGMDFNAEHVNDGDALADYIVTISTGEIREVTD